MYLIKHKLYHKNIHNVFHSVGETDLRRSVWCFGSETSFTPQHTPNPFSSQSCPTPWPGFCLGIPHPFIHGWTQEAILSAMGGNPSGAQPISSDLPSGQGADQQGGAELVRPVLLEPEGEAEAVAVQFPKRLNMAGTWSTSTYMPFTWHLLKIQQAGKGQLQCNNRHGCVDFGFFPGCSGGICIGFQRPSRPWCPWWHQSSWHIDVYSPFKYGVYVVHFSFNPCPNDPSFLSYTIPRPSGDQTHTLRSFQLACK